jgi:hypothetical protein
MKGRAALARSLSCLFLDQILPGWLRQAEALWTDFRLITGPNDELDALYLAKMGDHRRTAYKHSPFLQVMK